MFELNDSWLNFFSKVSHYIINAIIIDQLALKMSSC